MNAPVKDFAVFEPRPLFGIGTVARLTGIKPDTLRVWERRYGLRASHKSASGRRQYTQADLEHLQLIAALLEDGARIGEIATSERKTLEVLVKGRGRPLRHTRLSPKPTVLFIGQELCAWLDQHQGCISGVSALLLRQSLPESIDTLEIEQPIGLVVVDCPSFSNAGISALATLSERLNSPRMVVGYRPGSERWLGELKHLGALELEFPPDPARLAYEMGQVVVDADTAQGEFDLGDLVKPKPRIFSDKQLRAASDVKRASDCECPAHVAELIRSLNQFEEYASQCPVTSWQDASAHASLYAYTNQARHLMEKALRSILDEG